MFWIIVQFEIYTFSSLQLPFEPAVCSLFKSYPIDDISSSQTLFATLITLSSQSQTITHCMGIHDFIKWILSLYAF